MPRTKAASSKQTERFDIIRRREALKSKFKRFKSFFDDIKNASSAPNPSKLFELDTRLVQAESEWLSKFSEVELELEAVDLDDYDESELETFEQNCFSLFAEVKAFLSHSQSSPVSYSSVANTPAPLSPTVTHNARGHVGVKYPVIELPKFGGAYERWLEFKELFVSLIHNSTDLQPIQKMHYLRASLEGSAASCIQSVDLSNDNYLVAWEILCNRFDNKKLMVHKHIKNLFSIQDIKSHSPSAFRYVVDTISKNMKALETLKINTQSWDPLIIFLITSKLDVDTLREWEQRESAGELPTLNELKQFLSDFANLLDKLQMHKSRGTKPREFTIRDSDKSLSKSLVSSNAQENSGSEKKRFSCYYCQKPHSIFQCNDFLSLPTQKKHEKVVELKLCINCFQRNHQVNTCKYGNCKFCDKKHNSLLHPSSSNNITAVCESTEDISDDENDDAKSVQLASFCNHSSTNQVLLATAQVYVFDKVGRKHSCRALLDNGSMSNFISESFVEKLCLPKQKVSLSVVGIGQKQSTLNSSCDIQMISLHSSFNASFHCLIIPQITDNLPNISFDSSILNIPSNITLSDPVFSKPDKIDLLIGAEIFWSLILNEQIRLGENQPILQRTKLGWIISGPLGKNRSVTTLCNLCKNIDLQAQLSKFWEIEELSNKPFLSSEETVAEEHFVDTFKRNSDGRFIVSIPLKDSPNKLGDSKELATKQYLSLEKKLNSKPLMKEMYSSFMTEFKELAHMSLFQPSPNQVTYFAPHHGVIKEESLTTKLRVVFNCSAKSSSGISYNDLQLVGPTVQEDLFSILLRFRQHTYVISADISKMYRQIEVADECKALQLILWRDHPEHHLQTYSLNRVAYGTASAPYLATRCLLQLAIENEKKYPLASQAIRRDLYVDDLLTGASSEKELINLCRKILLILSSGCFDLRKWKSNSELILKALEPISLSNDSFFFAPVENSKTLGLSWSCVSDTFSFKISPLINTKHITKRTILSDIAKIFDPLGLLTPITITAKILLQSLWSMKLSWDEPVPQDVAKIWTEYRDDILELNKLVIPRHISSKDGVEIQIHGFADSSQKAYGAAVYLRTLNQNNDIVIHLITSKTRVAPLQSLSIPRLELCAAKLLSVLFNKVIKSLTLKVDTYALWSDSTVTLAWIRTSPHLLQTFVANRVADIQKLTNLSNWHYVPTESNPADLLSRGTSPKGLVKSEIWLHGPSWLKLSSEYWPKDLSLVNCTPSCEIPELRKQIISFVQVKKNTLFPFNEFSSLSHLKRVFAYMLRFINNCKKRQEKRAGVLSIEELRESLLTLCTLSQHESFAEEINDLENHQRVKNTSKLLNLNPFLNNNLIRVGGRLKMSSYSFNKKHPIILSSHHPLTNLLFRKEHFNLMHCGPQMLIASIRENYWPIAGKNLAKKVCRECIVCFRFKPKTLAPIMGNLPIPRVSQNLPFAHTGVDYAGPFLVKTHSGRGSKTRKCYICLFICLTVKAIHLEIVTELSTTAFLETFQRFIARRGKPSFVYSDNGKNFIGANNTLKELGKFIRTNYPSLHEQIANMLDIKWSFIPAYSPHQGGLWEAGVKSAKFHLKRTLQNSTLTFESLNTIVTQIEGILNSRPLTPLSLDPNDLEALTPAHFLIGRSLLTVPYFDLQHIADNRLSHYEKLEAIKQKFWTQWSKEYIGQLQMRTKWKVNDGKIAVGAMVLLKDDNLPPYLWRLGRVVSVHPGSDQIVRVISIKTVNGVVKRAVVKVCPLPIDAVE